jgi:hypothetical protein
MTFRIEKPIDRLDFAIDGRVLAHQPFGIDYRLPERIIRDTVRGYRLGGPQRGREAFVQWGEEFAPAGAVAEIRERLGTTSEHLISWVEPDGTIISIDTIVSEVETQADYNSPGFYQPVTIRFVERAPRRVHSEGTCNLVQLDVRETGFSVIFANGMLDWDRQDAYIAAFDGNVPPRKFYPWDGATIGAPNTYNINRHVGQPFFHPTADILFYANQSGLPLSDQQKPQAYNYSGGVLGSRIAQTAQSWVNGAGFAQGFALAPDASFLAVATGGGASPPVFSNINVWPWTGAAFGARVLAGAGNLPERASTSAEQAVDVHPDSNAIAYVSEITPFFYVFPWDGAALGTAVIPSPVPPANVLGANACRWHPSGNYVAIGYAGTPFVSVYPWDGSSLGAAITPAVVAPPGGGRAFGVEWSALGTVLFVSGSDIDEGHEFYAYEFDAATGTLGPRCDPDVQPIEGQATGLRRSRNNLWITFRPEFGVPSGNIYVYSTGLVTV